jgi:site-specific recombinase XerD
MNTKTTGILTSILDKFELFSHFSVDRLSTRDGTGMPFLIRPDGTPCLMANMYMLSLRDRKGRGGRQGLSRRGPKGGTMGEYASKLSQLVRLCHEQKVDFIEMNDAQFTHFIDLMRKDRHPLHPAQRKKSENTLIATGKVWLDFLSYVGRIHGQDSFVSSEGAIKACEMSYTIKTKHGKVIQRSYLHHHSFGPEVRFHRRNAITHEQIDKLKWAASNIESSLYVKIRRRCMIELLEHTGARRSEIGNIKTKDIIDAYRQEYPLLRLDTLKQEDDAERFVPVTKMLLHDIKIFITDQRRKILQKSKPQGGGQDYLFISERTGHKLSSETISNEILTLRKHAKIKTQVCTHMFRHAFITNLFCLFIQRHKIENEDSFRQSLLDSHTFLAEITQWTGHLSTDSLNIYIDLAFKKTANFSTTLNSVHLVMAMETFDSKLTELTSELELGLSIRDYKARLAQLIIMRDADFEVARKRAD